MSKKEIERRIIDLEKLSPNDAELIDIIVRAWGLGKPGKDEIGEVVVKVPRKTAEKIKRLTA